MFYSNRASGAGELIATVIPCKHIGNPQCQFNLISRAAYERLVVVAGVGVVAGRVKTAKSKNKDIEQQVKNIEKTTLSVVNGARCDSRSPLAHF